MYTDRNDAGKVVAENVTTYAGKNTVVLAIPRGGVPVGVEVSRALRAPLDIIVVRKIGAPHQRELAIGAVSKTCTFFDESTLTYLHVPQEYISERSIEERKEVTRRELLYRAGRSPLPLKDKTVIIVDDGMATGATAKAAALTVKKEFPKKVIFASPVCAKREIASLSECVDAVICVLQPSDFISVGQWYKNFSQTTDQEVIELLRKRDNETVRQR